MVTKTDLQQVKLKKKIEKFYISTEPFLKQGICPTKKPIVCFFR